MFRINKSLFPRNIYYVCEIEIQSITGTYLYFFPRTQHCVLDLDLVRGHRQMVQRVPTPLHLLRGSSLNKWQYFEIHEQDEVQR